jgi:5'-methylthioadenosine phosphorylase
MEKASIGVIGGSGLYDIEGLKIIEEIEIDTEWGKPSGKIMIAELDNVKIAFLPRHGKGHVLLPHEINVRANIAALKLLGVKRIVAFSAVGSLQEEIPPRDFVVPSQIIDRTKNRESTFFGEGIVAHIAFGDPFCQRLQSEIIQEIKNLNINLHTEKTLICMEGPAFSTRAESNLYRSWGADIINMSVLPEAKLAREAEICYMMVCMSTDYDCWKEDEEDVTVEMVIGNITANSDNAKALIKKIIPVINTEKKCHCNEATKYAIFTAPEAQNPKTQKKLKTIFPDYF